MQRAESWVWRLVMPALLLGGVMAGWVLLVAVLIRLWNWRFNAPEAHWSLPGGAWPWLAYYALQLMGGLWSANLEAWAFSLEVKASLLFLPLAAGIPGRPLGRDFWWSVGWGLTVFLSWRLLHAAWHHAVLDDSGFWTYAGFSGGVHPTYLSLHAAVAWVGLSKQWGGAKVLWPLTILFALCIGLMGSKAGILAAMTVALVEPVLKSRWPGLHDTVRTKWVSLAFCAVLLGSSLWSSGSRFGEMTTAVAAIQSEAAPVASSSAGRVAVWRSSLDVMLDHPFGVGTGDVTDELADVYAREGIHYARTRKLNPHNQWLQAGVAFGWPGVLVFSFIMWSWLSSAWQRRSLIGFLCGSLFLLHSGVESVLEVQRGVVFLLWLWMAIVEEGARIRRRGIDVALEFPQGGVAG
jgi:hypothetical protein